MTTTTLHLDYETFAEVPLVGPRSAGIWNYSRDMATEGLMAAYQFDVGEVEQVDLTQDRMPAELIEALLDPHVEKWAFNATFERLITLYTLGIPTPYSGWRCTMALANMQSFAGDLGTVGRAMGLPDNKLKDKEGKRLIHMFCEPQVLSRKNSLWRRTWKTDPDDWQLFLDYNRQDVVAEREIKDKLIRFPIPPEEWELYQLDQEINDRGLPVNRRFVQMAEQLSNRRKAELRAIMCELTGLNNPNSTAQILPWLQDRGYPFSDLQKNTVKKVLTENKTTPILEDDCVTALKLRQQASRTSVRKYPAILRRLAVDDRLRHCFRFAGAARTGRWSGQGPQPHNLVRTPGIFEAEDGVAEKLEVTSKVIAEGDYDTLSLLVEEPMVALAGLLRSSFQAHEGNEFVVCDLSAIESATIGWVTACKRLLRVFRNGLDPYKDFGTELYHKAYDAITKPERTICKPAVLGCGYRLGGGQLREGKRTGLWGYAEAMGVDITQEEAAHHVSLFRVKLYPEIPKAWLELEQAVQEAMIGSPTPALNNLVYFEMNGPYLTCQLPSGRLIYYYKPKMIRKEFQGKEGPYVKRVFSYMGMNQVTRQWSRIGSSGGKIIENIVQAIARDVLAEGMKRAAKEGFPMVGSVHDEILNCVRIGSNRFTVSALRDCMIAPIEWAKGLPLNAAGYVSTVYRKD